MSFLSIPGEEGLFTTIKSRKSAGEVERRFPIEDEFNDEDEEDEDDETENVHLIPRCSPVPRKRGQSIHDETAEYMRIHLELSAGKKVSFADTTGGDLVDVKEYAANDSEEEDGSRWEEEEAKYRKPQREATYHVRPEFDAPVDGALLRAVRTNKVEVEQISEVENEPLSFRGLIRVLNICFHKSVYIRSTMDRWATYFDHPAEYVQGSNDGDTDRFAFKLSFAPPYTTHGSRIEFVVRYETSDGDYWANNSSMNYAVTLLLSFDDESSQRTLNTQEVKGILKPPKAYSTNDDLDSEDEQEGDEEEAGSSRSGLVRPTAVYPAVVRPEIDVEMIFPPSGSSAPPNPALPSVDDTPSAHTASTGEQFPCLSSEATCQSNSPFVLSASESAQPDKPQLLHRLQCEIGDRWSEQPVACIPTPLLPSPAPSPEQESRSGSDSSQAAEVIPPSEASCMHDPTSETDLRPAAAAGEEATADQHVSAPSVVQQAVATGLVERDVGLSEGSTGTEAPHESRTPAPAPAEENRESLFAESESLPSPKLAEDSSASLGVTETSQNVAPMSVFSAWEEKEDAPQVPPARLLENPPNTLSEVSQLQPECDVIRSLMPAVVFLSGTVSLLIALQDPDVLYLLGLLLVLHRL